MTNTEEYDDAFRRKDVDALNAALTKLYPEDARKFKAILRLRDAGRITALTHYSSSTAEGELDMAIVTEIH